MAPHGGAVVIVSHHAPTAHDPPMKICDVIRVFIAEADAHRGSEAAHAFATLR